MIVPAWTIEIFEDHVRRHYFPDGTPLADMDLIDPVWAEKRRQDSEPSKFAEFASIPLIPPPLGRCRCWSCHVRRELWRQRR